MTKQIITLIYLKYLVYKSTKHIFAQNKEKNDAINI